MADALTRDARPSANPVKGPKKVRFGEKAVEMSAGVGEASKWKKKADAIFCLDCLQEEASDGAVLNSAKELVGVWLMK
jgi:hypothetical protein